MLTLYFHPTNSDLVSFHLSDEKSAAHGHDKLTVKQWHHQFVEQPVSFQELPAKIADLSSHKITVVIPGEQITSTLVQAPKGSRKHIAQAIPYLLEDDLATVVEELHVAIGKPDAEGQILCAVIAKKLLDEYLQKLAELAIHPSALIPDYWLLPENASTMTETSGQRLLIRRADNTGMTLPADTPASLLQQVIPGDNSTTCLPSELQDSSELQNSSDLSGTETTTPASIALSVQQASVNLLQGDYAPVTPQSSSTFKPAAIAAGICVLLIMAYFVAAGGYFNRQATHFAEEAEASYRQLFPNEKKILNIRRQMTAHINNRGGQQKHNLFFELTSVVSQTISTDTSNTQNSAKATVRHLRYDQNEATLQLELQADSMGYAHELQHRIEEIGYGAEVLSANSNDEGVVARLRLMEKQP